MIDRGFIKWQPFNSVIDSKSLLKDLNNSPIITKPEICEDKGEVLNELIKEAYYSQSSITITFYLNNKIATYQTKIIKINPNDHTLTLSNHLTIYINQIIDIKN